MLGLVVGSFLNVCIFRIPKKISIIIPSSHCSICEKSIPWYDNIPIFSFLILRGRCRFCKGRISFAYPIVEFLTAILFLLVFLKFGISREGFAMIIFLCLLLIVSFIDIKTYTIPDIITIPGILLGCFVFPLAVGGGSNLKTNYLQSLLGAVIGGGSLFLIGTIGEWILHKEAMGGGDVKLSTMIGAFLGWKGILLVFFLASLSGAMIGVMSMAIRGREKGSVIPFAPFLALGSFGVIFFGENIIRWLLGLIGW